MPEVPPTSGRSTFTAPHKLKAHGLSLARRGKVPAFRDLALSYANQAGQSTMLPVIEKELLHYEILDDMDQHGFLERLTFQGGTCLRLCYGSERYSEDLDFAGGTGFSATDFAGLGQILRDGISSRYGVEVEVGEPKRPNPDTNAGRAERTLAFSTEAKAGVDDRREEHASGLSVDTWRITVVTAPARPDLPRQRVSIQVANVPAHTRAVCPLRVNYPALPASYGQVLAVAETLEEICADKLKAFITSRFVRYRDLWDMRWLALQPGFDPGKLGPLLRLKLDDYHAHDSFRDGLGRLSEVASIVAGPEFSGQLGRFLPAATLARTLAKPAFRESLVDQVQRLYTEAGVTPS